MEFFEQLRIATIPRWAKFLISLFLTVLLFVALYVAFQGLVQNNKDKWVEASAFLLGTLLPITLIALITWVSQTGVSALQKQTSLILESVLPDALLQLEDYPENRYRDAGVNSKAERSAITLSMYHEPGRCDADYRLTFPANHLRKGMARDAELREIYFRIELNVRRVNVCLFIQKDICNLAMALKGATTVDQLFPHSFGGAKGGLSGKDYSYLLNSEIDVQKLNNNYYYRLVLFCTVPDDILYSPKEQLFFSQDFLFMIKSFIKEQTNLFELVAIKKIMSDQEDALAA